MVSYTACLYRGGQHHEVVQEPFFYQEAFYLPFSLALAKTAKAVEAGLTVFLFKYFLMIFGFIT